MLFWLVSFILHPVTYFRHRARYKRYLEEERKYMNYTQAYKALRSLGVTAKEARDLLENAELLSVPAELEQISVSYSVKEGFTITEEGAS